MTKTSSKVGRPTKYNSELVEEICNAIASTSKGIRVLCKENMHWPCQDTLFAWLKKYPEFSEQYAQAKICQIELLIDEILEISDDESNDYFIHEDGTVVTNNSSINRSRLKIDTRKWLASKLVPKVYGNRIDSDIQFQMSEELQKLSEEFNEKYSRDY
ncbi:Uncharacterised protein [Legionella wadsworthii]|uniref:Terminase small subunit n=1 Tax=Legionella wadsworthii TaxID=28088 RepID=A0A378LXW5_9GAMM|nr:hypothetical protein [Legionella wadsworthii]STY31504.1 Uncharacterised protein [Legionella wadsworthii]